MVEFALTPRVIPALRRLCGHYRLHDEDVLDNLISSCSVYVDHNVKPDSWAGDSLAHNVLIFVPHSIMELFDLNEQERFSKLLCDDLNRETNEIENEYVKRVATHLADESDNQCKMAIPLSREPHPSPDPLGIWKGKIFDYS